MPVPARGLLQMLAQMMGLVFEQLIELSQSSRRLVHILHRCLSLEWRPSQVHPNGTWTFSSQTTSTVGALVVASLYIGTPATTVASRALAQAHQASVWCQLWCLSHQPWQPSGFTLALVSKDLECCSHTAQGHPPQSCGQCGLLVGTLNTHSRLVFSFFLMI